MISMMAMMAGMAMAQTAPATETAVFYFDASGALVALDFCSAAGCEVVDVNTWGGDYDIGIHEWPGTTEGKWESHWENCREDDEKQMSVCDLKWRWVPNCSGTYPTC